MQYQSQGGFRNAFLSASLLFFTLGISVPCIIYLKNAGEFSIVLSDLLLAAVCMILPALALSAFLFRFLRFLRRPRFVAMLFALATLVWFQGIILVWRYGPLDGRSIDWAQFRLNGLIDSTIWLVVLVLAAWKPLLFFYAAPKMAPIIIAVQAIWLIFCGGYDRQRETTGTIKAYSIDESRKYSFSVDRNAILIVLDEVQSNIFADVLKSEASYRNIFDGFVYFPDAVAGSNYTELAVPALLTGRLYDNSVPRSQYLKNAYLHDSVFAILKRNGFSVDIFPWEGWANETVYFDEAIADNLKPDDITPIKKRKNWTEKKIKEVVRLMDLALFRSAPHILKPYIYNNQRWFLIQIISEFVPDKIKAIASTDNIFETTYFAEKADQNISADRKGLAFKYYHLKGNHAPLTATEDMQITQVPVPYTHHNYVLQLKTSIKGIEKFLAAMKRVNIYDRSLIIIVGDHGSGMAEGLYLNTPKGARPKVVVGSRSPRGNFRKDKARGVPLVLVKRVGSRGSMKQLSELPVSLLDIPATIAYEMGLEPVATGIPMFQANLQANRVRRYAAIEMSPNKTSYLDDITIYEVSGNSWQDDSWKISGVLSPPSGH